MLYCAGELKQPSKAIPKGTLTATMFTLASYLIETLLIASTADRQMPLFIYYIKLL